MSTGTLTLQAHGREDVFHIAFVSPDGLESSDETLMQVEEPLFDSDKAWITGRVPQIKRVQVEGDSALITGWFKGETYTDPIVIKVYIECETAEELEGIEESDEQEERVPDILDPIEINL